ncbi:outer membrane protein [Anianabacter salinae]|uniref:outer membrane protein n=1 Tax=Anianabacter salinae TaxID=2851023 RepID=UPI00225E5893|nr:outer membrane beta-barrel protein [Anianabacter salinae]MBV0911912.1 outer membrane beta-barrel protein [Anianabacter salinae]
MKTLLIAGGSAALISTSAFAGNLDPAPVEPVIVQPAPVAAPAGVDWSGSYGGVSLGYGTSVTSTAPSGDGIVGGAFVGYNYDFGNFVVGAETEYQQSGITYGGGAGRIDNFTRLKAKFGVEADRALFYATGGATLANGTVNGNSFSDTGYNVGVGMDYAVTDRWTVGAEALYNRFDDVGNTTTDVDATTFSARVGYRF